MTNYQYPHLSNSERRILKAFKNCPFLERLFAIRKWKKYYFASLKRSVRAFSESHSHISFKGHIDLPPEFNYKEEISVPRGNRINGQYYSSGYEAELVDLPKEIRDLVLSFRDIVQSYFACETNVSKAQFWRNLHVPTDIAEAGEEVFSDAFHQDLVFDQYNIQLFILLHDVTEKDGPFEYLDGAGQVNEMKYYIKRNRKVPLSKSEKLVGKRGDYLLFTTGLTLHKAGIPSRDRHRDIMSIAFFPSYTNIGRPISELS
jgi:hypothetical protein